MFQIIPLFGASEVTPRGGPSQEGSERSGSTALLWTRKVVVGEEGGKNQLEIAERIVPSPAFLAAKS